MDYYIYLKNLNEYIQETDDDTIWTRTKNINYAFTDCDYDRVNRIAQFVCNDKHLCYKDLLIIGEEIVIETTEFPVGNLKKLYFIGNNLSDDLTKLHKSEEKYSLFEISELAFAELYYTIDNIQELLDWCKENEYKWFDLEKDFNISIWEE